MFHDDRKPRSRHKHIACRAKCKKGGKVRESCGEVNYAKLRRGSEHRHRNIANAQPIRCRHGTVCDKSSGDELHSSSDSVTTAPAISISQ